MTIYDFDERINRYGTDSLKFDRAEDRGHSPDLLSLWVADMDFKVPEPVTRALVERAQHGVFGYTEPGPAFYDTVAAWLERRYGWRTQRSWHVLTPGVVFALAAAVRATTDPGGACIIQPPVYYPFRWSIKANGRTVVNAPLRYDGNAYQMDFDALDAAFEQSCATALMLCNPHNPVGRAWTRDELQRLAGICLRHGASIISDEIHMDFARPGHTHTVLASLGDDVERSCITCTSASKTFNLAGLQLANIIIPDDGLRARFDREVQATGYSQPNALGLVAAQAAYEQGGEWLDQLKGYLEGNWRITERTLADKIPEAHLVPAESTYLAWIDLRFMGMGDAELERFIEDEAGLWLDCGHIFGPEGAGFIRINLATQAAYLQQALDQLAMAIGSRA